MLVDTRSSASRTEGPKRVRSSSYPNKHLAQMTDEQDQDCSE